MILGSHNTMTYLPVKQWYFKPLFWTARCQAKTLAEQFEAGVRLFDFRVRFDENGDLTFAHGPIKFKGSVYSSINYLNILAKTVDEPIYARVILESNSKMKDQDLQEEHFRYFCESLEEDYKRITFFGGNRKYDWKKIYDFKTEEPSLDDKYSSTTKWLPIDDIWPWLYAKFNNKKNLNNGTDKDVLFIDFI